jgi:flagellar biosynthesis/type III secretory pathway protein FliH
VITYFNELERCEMKGLEKGIRKGLEEGVQQGL